MNHASVVNHKWSYLHCYSTCTVLARLLNKCAMQTYCLYIYIYIYSCWDKFKTDEQCRDTFYSLCLK